MGTTMIVTCGVIGLDYLCSGRIKEVLGNYNFVNADKQTL